MAERKSTNRADAVELVDIVVVVAANAAIVVDKALDVVYVDIDVVVNLFRCNPTVRYGKTKNTNFLNLCLTQTNRYID